MLEVDFRLENGVGETVFTSYIRLLLKVRTIVKVVWIFSINYRNTIQLTLAHEKDMKLTLKYYVLGCQYLI